MSPRSRLIANPARPISSARRQRQKRLLAVRSVRDSLISLAGLVGAPAVNQAGDPVGRVADVVARWDGQEAYPAVTGMVLRIGGRRSFAPIDQIATATRSGLTLASARLSLLEFERRDGEVLLARDVLDHQLVDVDGVQVIRPADLYLANTPAPGGSMLRLVGVDVSAQTLLRRLGPKRWRGVPTPDRVIDWATIRPFGSEVPNVGLRASRDELRRLRPGELADLLEDLGRDARQELLASLEPERAADALEEMDPEELGALLRETPPEEAAALVARMEPDEAVDALRDLEDVARIELLEHMEPDQAEALTELLEYEEDRAGGFMTSRLVVAHPEETVRAIRRQLRKAREHSGDVDGIAVVDVDGRLVGDIPLYELAIATNDSTFSSLLPEGECVSVSTDATVIQVAERLIETRHSSIVVVDEDRRPVGRILADDLLDALLPERGRHHFPRFLT
ncbi:MAG TPA: CBS domain-containing protein [Acidimicrobiales bacterium]|jgi:CBS domain-containing protein|nr:CBS domain-containing protein [Acidimicrobiales bacterium]